MTFGAKVETCCLCRGWDYVCSGVIVSCRGVTDSGKLCGTGVGIEDLPNCCSAETFGCFCEQNPL